MNKLFCIYIESGGMLPSKGVNFDPVQLIGSMTQYFRLGSLNCGPKKNQTVLAQSFWLMGQAGPTFYVFKQFLSFPLLKNWADRIHWSSVLGQTRLNKYNQWTTIGQPKLLRFGLIGQARPGRETQFNSFNPHS